jgi:ABC-type Mn2+/Zn2+ transport system permease subunit
VIADFIAAWPLFHWAWIAGWILAAMLASLGVVVVARDQIFIGAAVAQASMLGVAIGLQVTDVVGVHAGGEGELWLHGCAVLASVLAALVTARGGRAGRASHEALTGWVFLAAGSLAILVVVENPHGSEEVHRLLASSMIGALPADVAILAILALASAVGLACWWRPLVLVTLDPVMATAVGVRVERWQAGIACWLGVVVGLAMPVAGSLYTFGCLVLPALVARAVCREVAPMFLVAPAVGVAATAASFVVAHHLDWPPAQVSVATLCLLVAATGTLRLRRRAPAGPNPRARAAS